MVQCGIAVRGGIASAEFLPQTLDNASLMVLEMLERFFQTEEDACCGEGVNCCCEDIWWCVGVGFQYSIPVLGTQEPADERPE